MKNKITKLFLAVFALFFGKMNAQEGGQPMPDYVRKVTNVEFLNEFSKEKEIASKDNYAKALGIAKSRNMEISGVQGGYYFSLVGVDEETGVLRYLKTTNNTPTNSSLQTANAKPLQAAGINGAGMRVGVWDGGVGLTNHLGFNNNRYKIKDNGNSFPDVETRGKNHAAHVAGTIAANSFGNGQAKGFAPEAQVFAYNWISDTPEMAAAAANVSEPIYVSNHSYGLNTYAYIQQDSSNKIFGQYNTASREIDVIANNAPYYTIVFAAGNDRDPSGNYLGTVYNPSKNGKDLLTREGVSKNNVVVAAVKGTEDFSGITGINSVSGTNQFIGSFSNYGPTDDFRVKPDISAKGVNVLSITQETITHTDVYDGTSMAAPAVTGVFTLWQQYHNQTFLRYMRSASVRALMAHTAKEAGPAAGPDFMFGWGLIDADKGKQVMDAAHNNTAIFKEFDLQNGARFDYDFAYNGQQPLVVTIAWNDPAGLATDLNDVNIKKLINDLDLRVVNTDNQTVYFPWSLVHNWNISATNNGIAVRNVDNTRDNIEKVELPSNIAGNYKVEITHKGTLVNGPQNFSLIISGAGGEMPTTENALGITDVEINNLKVYPNPVTDVIKVEGQLSNLKGAKLLLNDITGKVLKKQIVNNENQELIGVSDLQAGTYILTVEKDNIKKSFKIIKK